MIGEVKQLSNPDISARMQTLKYATMAGAERAAITGEVLTGCLKIHFVAWDDSAEAERTETDMAAFLKGLRIGGPLGQDAALDATCDRTER